MRTDGEVSYGTPARPPWAGGEDTKRHRLYSRSPWEWLPRPYKGSMMVARNASDEQGVYLQVVPGPMGLWQVVRVELNSPVARGFRTPEKALDWVARAVRAGVLPKGVVVVEPPPTE